VVRLARLLKNPRKVIEFRSWTAMARTRARPPSDPRALQAKVDAARQAVAAVHANAAPFHFEAGKRRALHETHKCEDKDQVEAMARRLRAAMKDEALMIECWTRFADPRACASVQQFRRVFPTVDSFDAFICCAWDTKGTTELERTQKGSLNGTMGTEVCT